MARRGDEAQAEALEIVERIVERVDFQFAAVARAGIDFADRQAAAEPALRRTVEIGGQRCERSGFGDRGTQALQEGLSMRPPVMRSDATSNSPWCTHTEDCFVASLCNDSDHRSCPE